MADATEQSITVVCTCGRKLKAPASAVGRKARCKGCGAVMTIQAEDVMTTEPVAARTSTMTASTPRTATRPAAKKPAPPPPPADDDPLSALYDLAQEEKNASQIVDDSPRCPQCISPLTPNAVICTSCGYNVRTGKALQTAKGADAPKKPWFGGSKKTATTPSGKKVEDAMAPQGSFMLGLVGCSIGGLVGGVIWFLVSWFSGYELGFIALLVGAAAGLGMQIGQKGYSSLGGGVAALVAFLSIILAKAAVVIAIVIPLMNAEDSLYDGDHDERVVDLMMEEEYAARQLDSDETSVEEDEAVMKAVEKKLAKMSKTEMDAAVARVEDATLNDDLAEYMVYAELETMKVDPGDANEVQITFAEKQAADKIAKMTVPERKAELKRLEAKEEAEYAAAAAAEAEADASAGASGDEAYSDDEESGAGGAVALAGLGLLFYIFFGGWKSILFLVLAVSLAYRTASGSASG